MLLLSLLACPPIDKAPVDTGAVDDTDYTVDDTDLTDDTATGETAEPGPSCVEEPEPPASRDTGVGPSPAETLTGTIEWTLEFDADAEALGYTDCTYTRTYAQLEVADRGYLCPECELLTTGTSVMTDGYEDCFLQISDDDAERTEHIGFGTVDGETHFFRTGTLNLALGDLGAVTTEAPYTFAYSSENELTDGGIMILSFSGELVRETSETETIPDLGGAIAEPYTCGWPQNSPGGPNASWDVADGEIFPNLRLIDQCDEPVDLWDFRGYYLVIDSSSPDCGPCQAMADGAEEFKARMAAQCAPVEMLTLLNESLGAINHPASAETVDAWVAEWGLQSPVVQDEGAGYALMPEYLGVEDGMSYPGVIVLDPDGRVIYGATGFGEWSEFGEVILADWEVRSGG